MEGRAQHRDDTRLALGRAASELFLEVGYEAATAERIAARAGVSRRTFFRYFATKDAAFFGEHEARRARFDALVEARAGTVSAWVAVREALLDVAAELQADREGWLAWSRALQASPRLVAADVLEDGRWAERIRAHLLAAGMPEEVADVWAGASMGLVRAVLVAWTAHNGDTDLVAAGRRAFAVLEAGVR